MRQQGHRILARIPAPQFVRHRQWAWEHPPSEFVTHHLTGMLGVEIGASAHNDYGLRAINIDRYADMDTIYKREEMRLCGRKRMVDLVAPGDDLPLRDETVDFVFASHVIEHFPDPIRAIDEWCRVARERVVLVVPHRDRTFDADRELTTAEELLQRHADGFTSDEDKHWSVWTRESFLEMCGAAGFPVVDSLDPDDKITNGFIVVIDAAASRVPEQRARRAGGVAV
jgi:SAM-dependent methyltransferase